MTTRSKKKDRPTRGRPRVLQDPSLPAVRMGAFLVPPAFTAVWESVDEEPSFEIKFEVRDGAAYCQSVRIEASEGGVEVQPRHLRALRLEDQFEWAVARVGLIIHEVRPNGEVIADQAGSIEEARRLIREGQTARTDARRTINMELLRNVAEIYRDNEGGAPTQAVADRLGKSLRTASLYVKNAREAGLLPSLDEDGEQS